MNTVGFGIIGCGTISHWHGDNISSLADHPSGYSARLAAVADILEEKAKAVGEKYGVPYHLNYEDLLARQDVDAVSICLPSGLHRKATLAAALAGKHVLTQKPIDITLEAADLMIKACRMASVKLGVIFQNRFHAGTRRLKALMDARMLGRIISTSAYAKSYRSQEYYDSGDWRGTRELDGGGCLMNQGVHLVDVYQWLMGPVESISAVIDTQDHDIEVEDTANALLRFASGAHGVLEGSTCAYPGLPHRIEVHGSLGTAVLEEGRLARWDPVDDSFRLPEEDAAFQPADGKAGHRAQIHDFVQAIVDDRAPAVNGEEGRKSLEIILGVYESGVSGRTVFLGDGLQPLLKVVSRELADWATMRAKGKKQRAKSKKRKAKSKKRKAKGRRRV